MKGQRVGYVRVSTHEQNTDRQLEGVSLDRCFTDRASGKDVARPELIALKRFVREGDIVMVHSMDRLARNLDDLRQTVRELASRGVCIEFVKEGLKFTGEDSPMAQLMLSVMGAFAEFERSLLRERQREGITLAKQRGVYRGRKPSLDGQGVADLMRRVAQGERKSDIARDLGICRETVYANVRNIVLMRPVASMIEFKQIIGRGTRLYDGKDHFTIYDFVRAHHHFNDPAWDGEPLAPEVPEGRAPRVVEAADGADPAALHVAEPEPVGLRPAPIEVKLADGKLRRVQHMTATTFWSADGRPMSAAQFLESLFGALPGFFKDEDELRRLWSAPDTRKALLAGLADKGFGREALADMQKVIKAENSDLFDVLAYVAFAADPVTRADRAAAASAATAAELPDKQQAFVDFVLAQYVKQGVDELDAEKLSPLLRLRYQALSDAFAELGKPDQVRQVFVGFQHHLYGAGVKGGLGSARS